MMIKAMIKNIYRFYHPLPMVVLALSIIILTVLYWTKVGAFNYFSLIIFIISTVFLFSYKQLVVSHNRCEFHTRILFFRLANKEIEIGEVQEIILISNISSTIIQSLGARGQTGREITNISNDLFLKNKYEDPIVIFRSANFSKVNKLAIFFSKYYNIPVQIHKKENFYSSNTDPGKEK
ncbi:hypothetical protein QUH73_15600 [Labilibaculum sp. K2S]|uniref:hypothetical protein n=1 Tax=Labilibaculum sp. K2S TaxID=3056386 RepID=UPI0025A3B143|nr:hypothetical protein [Labilibaculum sp. K2S]MDM8161249.1 hypothetical protein [Labilibaculum sp. K2S]